MGVVKMSRLFIVTVILFSSILSTGGIGLSVEDKPIPGLAGLGIPEKDLSAFEERALGGDAEAAHRLSTFYSMVRYDPKQCLYWTAIAAENGSIPAQVNLGLLLRDDPDPKNRRRAVYWLKRAAETGDELAARYLKETLGK
jgi:TPR repeat protein